MICGFFFVRFLVVLWGAAFGTGGEQEALAEECSVAVRKWCMRSLCCCSKDVAGYAALDRSIDVSFPESTAVGQMVWVRDKGGSEDHHTWTYGKVEARQGDRPLVQPVVGRLKTDEMPDFDAMPDSDSDSYVEIELDVWTAEESEVLRVWDLVTTEADNPVGHADGLGAR